MDRRATGTAGVITGAGRDASAPVDFADAVMAALSGSVPFDGYCLFGTDPLSGVRTFMYSRHGLDGVAEQLTYNEFVEVDANRYRDLSTAPRPIGVMSRADRARPPQPPHARHAAPDGVRLRAASGAAVGWLGVRRDQPVPRSRCAAVRRC